MTPWSAFYPFILPEVLGCPQPTVDHHVLQASREFLKRTLLWDVWLDADNTVAEQANMDFLLQSGQEVTKLLEAKLAGADLPVLSVNDVPGDPLTVKSGQRGIFTIDMASYWLTPTPIPADQAIQVRVALVPSQSALGLQDFIWRDYADDIATGAKARLLALNGKDITWANPARAQQLKDYFELCTWRVAHKVGKSNSRTPRRVVPSFF
jgi:hypothetical protein